MGFTLYWTDQDLRDSATDFSQEVAEELEKALKEKKRQVAWKNDMTGLSRRVHNLFGLAGLHVAEIQFTARSAEYRAVCIVVPEEEYVVYFRTVPKKGSAQGRLLRRIRENSQEIREFIRRKAGLSSA